MSDAPVSDFDFPASDRPVPDRAESDLPVDAAGYEWRPGRVIPWSELNFQQDTAGGPGGQHANRSATRVTLIWHPAASVVFSARERERICTHWASRLSRGGELRLRSGRERSALANRRVCLEQLSRWLEEALVPVRARVATRPTAGSKRRRVQAKTRRGQVKQDRRRPPVEE